MNSSAPYPHLAGEIRNRFSGSLEVSGNLHAPLYANRVPVVNGLVRVSGHAWLKGNLYPRRVSKKSPKPRHFLREWRQFHKMTLEDLAEAVGTTKGVISELELSKKGLSHKWLLRLAPALKTMPGMILDYHPADVDHEALDAFLRAGTGDKGEVLRVISVLHKKAG